MKRDLREVIGSELILYSPLSPSIPELIDFFDETNAQHFSTSDQI